MGEPKRARAIEANRRLAGESRRRVEAALSDGWGEASQSEADRALLAAVSARDAGAARAALSAGANPNARGEIGFPAASLACVAADRATLGALIEAGADLDREDTGGDRPIGHALRSCSLACLEALLAAGANPNAPQSLSRHPLSMAVGLAALGAHDQEALAAALLAHGADPLAEPQGEEACPPLEEAAQDRAWDLLDLMAASERVPLEAARDALHFAKGNQGDLPATKARVEALELAAAIEGDGKRKAAPRL